MCHLCEQDDAVADAVGWDRCVCVLCGAEVCYEDTEDSTIRKPSERWDIDPFCQQCFELVRHVPAGEPIPQSLTLIAKGHRGG